jgi:broad specificity phosphatase PhoE
MWPKTVYIIRHAEKPEDPHDPNLSPQGIERAQALAKNFEKLFGKLDCLFAAETSAASARSVETIDPLAQAIHLEIDSGVATKTTPSLRLSYWPTRRTMAAKRF